MSNVLAMMKADAREFGLSEQYIAFCEKNYSLGLITYDPDTKEVCLTEKALREGFSLRSANSLN